ncbi:MAG: hypothetical protein GXP01_07970 [Alphaproteobacteria bacterium]|nr:hypothetical protein [Alphaproteobacteria bacterium]
MKLQLVLAAALLTAVPLAGAAHEAEPVETLHVGPGNAYEVLATIRPGTSPRTRFCQYQGRWCYGSYGRWNGWFYGGENITNRWTLRYLLGR